MPHRSFPNKHPDTDRRYSIEWTDDLLEAEKVAISTWEIDGPDNALTYSGAAITEDGKFTSVRLQGGTDGAQYRIINRIDTDAIPPTKLVTVKLINVRAGGS